MLDPIEFQTDPLPRGEPDGKIAALLLSSDHNWIGVVERDDAGLSCLLDLDGWISEVGGGFWVKVRARRVEPSGLKRTVSTMP